MSQYVESAVFRVKDEATGPLRAIDKELRALARSAKAVQGAFGAENARGLTYMASFASQATKAVAKLKTELAGVNAELARIAKDGVRLNRGSAIQPDAGVKLARAAAQQTVAEDRAAQRAIAAAHRDAARQTIADERAVQVAIANARKEAGRAALQAAREQTAGQKDMIRQTIAEIRAEAQAERASVKAFQDAERSKAQALRQTERAAAQSRKTVETNAHSFLHGAGVINRAALYAGGAGFVAGHAVHAMVRDAANYEHDIALGGSQGLTPDENSNLQRIAADLSGKNQTVSIRELYRLGRSEMNILPNRKEALEVMPEAARLYAAIKSQSPEASDVEIRQKVEAASKTAEELGLTRDTQTFKLAMDSVARATNTMGDQFDPRQLMQLAKYASTAGMRADPKFILEEGVVLGQVLKGSRAGTGLMAMYSQFARDYKNGAVAENLYKEGLLGDDGVMRDAKGKITGSVGGKLKDFDKFANNPLEWFMGDYLPTIAKNHSIDLNKLPTDKGEQNKVFNEVAKDFGTRTAQQIGDLFGTQYQRILKEVANIRKAKGLDSTEGMADAETNFLRFSMQLDNASTALGNTFTPAVGKAAGFLADQMSDFADAVRRGRTATLMRDAGIVGGGAIAGTLAVGKIFSMLTGLGTNTTATSINSAAVEANTVALGRAAVASAGGGLGAPLAGGAGAAEKKAAGGLLGALGLTALRLAGPAALAAYGIAQLSESTDSATSADRSVYGAKGATPASIKAELDKAQTDAAKLIKAANNGEIGQAWGWLAKKQIDDIRKYLGEAYQAMIPAWLKAAGYDDKRGFRVKDEGDRETRKAKALSGLDQDSEEVHRLLRQLMKAGYDTKPGFTVGDEEDRENRKARSLSGMKSEPTVDPKALAQAYADFGRLREAARLQLKYDGAAAHGSLVGDNDFESRRARALSPSPSLDPVVAQINGAFGGLGSSVNAFAGKVDGAGNTMTGAAGDVASALRAKAAEIAGITIAPPGMARLGAPTGGNRIGGIGHA